MYLVSGDEPLQLGESVDAIRRRARALDFQERIVFEVDKSFDWNRIQEEAANMSLFASKKIIELRLGNLKPGRDGGAYLIDYAGQVNTDILLLISCGKLDKKTQQTKWYKAVDKAGATLAVWPIEATRLPDWIQQRFRQQGKRIDVSSAELIAQRVEGNLLAASQEIKKLCLLATDEHVSTELVSQAVVDSARFDVFSMMDAVFSGDQQRAIRMLYSFKTEGVEPMAIYGAVMWSLRQVAAVAEQIESGNSVETALSSMWGLNPQRKTALKQLCRRLQPTDIKHSLILAGKLDRIIKGRDKLLTWACLVELCQLLVKGLNEDAVLINSLAA